MDHRVSVPNGWQHLVLTQDLGHHVFHRIVWYILGVLELTTSFYYNHMEVIDAFWALIDQLNSSFLMTLGAYLL
ncbi:hypothetical protein ACJX0J_035166, partial [Zea mays]